MSILKTLERSSRRSSLRLLGTGGLVATLAAGGLGRATGVGGLLAVAGRERDGATHGGDVVPLPKVVLDWFGAWSSDEPNRNLAALYAADGSYEDVPSGASVLAPDIAGYLAAAPVRPATVNRSMRGTFAVDGLAVVEQLFYATNEAFAPGTPAGAPFEVFALTLFEYDDQRLHRSADYYDYGSILRQIGVSFAVPSAGDANVLLA